MAADLLVGGSPLVHCAGQKASATALGGDTALHGPKALAASTHCAAQEASHTATPIEPRAVATDLLVGGSPNRTDCAGQKASATTLTAALLADPAQKTHSNQRVAPLGRVARNVHAPDVFGRSDDRCSKYPGAKTAQRKQASPPR